MGQEVIIPYEPRPLQETMHAQLDAHRFSVSVCHRRFGKTVLAVNQLLKCALTSTKPRPRYAYVAPTFTQGKSIAWDYLTHYSRPVPGMTPNVSELRVDFPHNDSQVRIYGADNPDRLRGLYLDGVVLDEYGLMPPRIFSEVVRPALSDRQGWALFIGTPNGKNQFYELIHGSANKDWLGAKADPAWFFSEYKASETGILSAEELTSARASMTADEYDQEYECSFEASVRGAIYAREMAEARAGGRICSVLYDPSLPVDTDWDLGVGDAMCIWFSQSVRGSGEVRLIDYHEASGEGFPYYANILKNKGYVYGTHWAPHDIAVRELGSGKSRLEMASGFGLRFEVTPRIHGHQGHEVEEGIHTTRLFLARCWFDQAKCKAGIEALMHYRRDFNQRLNEFKAAPVHDWASHGADAFRGLAVRYQHPKTGNAPMPSALTSSEMSWMV